MLPVLDLRPLLGAPALPLASSARLVVLARDGVGRRPGRRGRPGRVRRRAGRPVAAAADPAAGRRPRWCSARWPTAHGPIAVLDAAAVLALRDRVDRRRHVLLSSRPDRSLVPRPAYRTALATPDERGDGPARTGRRAVEALVEFWKRLNGASTVTLGMTLVAATAAVLLDQAARRGLHADRRRRSGSWSASSAPAASPRSRCSASGWSSDRIAGRALPRRPGRRQHRLDRRPGRHHRRRWSGRTGR